MSPMLYCHFSYDCVYCQESTQTVKFADGTTLIGIITNFDEFDYRDQVKKRISWWNENNMELNAKKRLWILR